MADLLARQAVALDADTRQSFTSLTVDLDPQTEWIQVAIDRPTSVPSAVVWDDTTTIGVRVQVLLDGQVYEVTGRSTGGVRQRGGVDIDTYLLRWKLPAGYFGGPTAKRLGETRRDTFRMRVGLNLLRGSQVATRVQVTGESAPLALPARHNSVAFDSSASAVETSGDGVISFSITSTGSDRAAFVAVGSRGTSLDGTVAITGGGETISSPLWDVVSAPNALNSRGYSIVNQATGSQTLTSDLTATSTTDHFLGIVTMTGVNQAAPTGGLADVAPGFDTQPSCTVTGVGAADLVLDFLLVQTAPTVGANQTERENPANTPFPTYFRISTQSGADGGEMSWTYAASTNRCLNAVVFKAQATAAVTGTATAAMTEADGVAGGKTVILTLTDETYVPASVIGDISFIANALGGTTTTTTFSITLPTTQAGDLLILEFAHRGTGDGTIGGTSVTVGGLTWTLKHSQLFGSSAFSGKTYWTRATGDHAGQTVTGASLTNSCAAIVTQYRGAAAAGDPLSDATIVGEQNASGDETQAEITTTTDKAWVVLVVVNSPDLAVATQACTSPGTLTERAERLSTGGTDSSIAHASAEKATAGATGALTWTQTDAASGSWAYAIKPNVTTPFADARAAMRDGGDSAQSEAGGWDAKIKPNIPLGNIVRTSDTVVTITLQAQADYDITAQETITWTVPATILTGGAAIVATPTFTIDPSGGGGGTEFTQDVAGTLTSTGTLAKQTGKNGLVATMTSAGAVAKQTARSAAGTLTSAGSLVKQCQKVLTGDFTPAGALAATKVALMSVAGTLTSAGALVKQTNKAAAGTLTTAGAVVKQAQKVVAGGLTSTGTVVKQTQKNGLVGTLTPSGVLSATKVALLSITGTLTSAGSLVKQAGKNLAGAMTSSGALVKQDGKVTGGTLATAGTVTKSTGKGLAGTLTPAGAFAAVKAALVSLGGTLTSAGSLTKQTWHGATGTLTPAGTVSKRTATSKAGTLGMSGVVAKTIFGALLPGNGGTLGMSGSVSKQTTRHTSGRLSFAEYAGWFEVGRMTQDLTSGRLVDLGGTLYYVGTAFTNRSTDNGRTWTELNGPLGGGLLSPTAVAFGSQIWVIGGLDVGGGAGFGIRPEVYVSSDGNTWSAGPTLPVPLYQPAAVVHDGHVWVMGGFTDLGAGSRKVFKSDGGAWVEVGLDALPIDLYGACATVLAGRIYLYGGQTDTLGGLASQRVYRTTTGVWAEVGTDALPYAVFGAHGVTLDGQLWLIGGSVDAGTTRKVYRSATEGATWVEVGTDALPDVFSDGGAVARGPHVWITGGFNIFRSVLCLTVTSHLQKTTWKNLAAILTPSGTITKAVRFSLAGVLGMAGQLARRIPRSITGTLGLVGSLVAQVGGAAIFAMLTARRTIPGMKLARRSITGTLAAARTIRTMLRAKRGN